MMKHVQVLSTVFCYEVIGRGLFVGNFFMYPSESCSLQSDYEKKTRYNLPEVLFLVIARF